MHYRVGKYDIRSEYAAKTIHQPSMETVRWINSQPYAECALDYGCGKLRYASHLAARCGHLTLVDSSAQLSREQRLGDCRCTITEYASLHWPNTRCLDTEQFVDDSGQYDLVLCANVLSAIPELGIRYNVISRIAERLSKDGRAFFVTQYRNSYFTEARSRPNAHPHLDGWILDNRRWASFYGLIPRAELLQLVQSQGLLVIRSWVRNGSAFVEAGVR